jgi:hypothetical protein
MYFVQGVKVIISTRKCWDIDKEWKKMVQRRMDIIVDDAL